MANKKVENLRCPPQSTSIFFENFAQANSNDFFRAIEQALMQLCAISGVRDVRRPPSGPPCSAASYLEIIFKSALKLYVEYSDRLCTPLEPVPNGYLANGTYKFNEILTQYTQITNKKFQQQILANFYRGVALERFLRIFF